MRYSLHMSETGGSRLQRLKEATPLALCVLANRGESRCTAEVASPGGLMQRHAGENEPR